MRGGKGKWVSVWEEEEFRKDAFSQSSLDQKVSPIIWGLSQTQNEAVIGKFGWKVINNCIKTNNVLSKHLWYLMLSWGQWWPCPWLSLSKPPWPLGAQHGTNIGWDSYILMSLGKGLKKSNCYYQAKTILLHGETGLGLPLLLKVSSAAALPPLRFKLKWHLSLSPLSFLLMLLVVKQMKIVNKFLAESCFEVSLQTVGSIILWDNHVSCVPIIANIYWVSTFS